MRAILYMHKRSWGRFWLRFLLWGHVIGVVGFYAFLLRRTVPRKSYQYDIPHLPLKNADAAAAENDGPLVSIIVPARNEERNIRRCVQSLLEQDYAHYEVIVVDDGSTDETARIVQELEVSHPSRHRLRLLRLHELPPGWAGKPHALHRGIQIARGEWLLLTDADTWHAPNALRSTLTQAIQDRLDLLTIWLTQELPTFWDRVMMPMAYMGISTQYPPHLVNDPQSPVAVANGAYILLRHEVYNTLGGYDRPGMRGTLLDDRDLARLVKEHGYRLRFMDGCGLVHIHMYRSFGEIWRGWRKNAFLGSRGGLGFFFLQLLGLPMVSVLPFLLPLLAWWTKKRPGKQISFKESSVATVLEFVPIFVYRLGLDRHLRVPWYYVFTHPLAGALFEGILSQSAWRILMRRGVDWRGRQYHDGKRVGDLAPARAGEQASSHSI